MVLMAIMGVSLVDLVGSSSEHHTREGVQGTLAHGSCGCIYPCIVVVVVYISLHSSCGCIYILVASFQAGHFIM